MKLLQVLDADRGMYVVADDFAAALEAWRNLIADEDDLGPAFVAETPNEIPNPDGILLVCGSDDLLIVEESVAVSD